MPTRLVCVLVACAALTVGACSSDGTDVDDSSGGAQIQVVTAFFPLAEAAEIVGGDLVEVTNLTPAGAEPHGLELTTGERSDIEDADVLIVMGRGFQPAVEEVAEARSDGVTVEMLSALSVGTDSPDSLDPHVWLDPVLMADIVDETVSALSQADPDNQATYRANGDAYQGELAALDTAFAEGLADCASDVVVSAHDAFGYLTVRYDLRPVAIAGLSPDQEPSAQRVAELADLVKDEGVTTVFTEELVSPKVAESLAREAGVTTATLDPLEGLSKADADAGKTYLSIMEENLAALRTALRCS